MTGLVTITSRMSDQRLVTVEQAKAELNLSDATDDVYVAGLVNRASSVIARHCARTLGVTGYSETFRHNYSAFPLPIGYVYPDYHYRYRDRHHRPLIVSNVPIYIGNAATVEAAVTITVDGTQLAQDGSDYEIDAEAGLIWRLIDGYRMHWTGLVTVVEYSAGYVCPNDTAIGDVTLPYDIQDACLQLVRSAYFGRATDSSVQYELVEGVGRIQYRQNRNTVSMTVDAPLEAQLSPYVSRVF